MASKTRRYWLVKSEPDVFSYDDLVSSPGKRTFWDGVRNYQARNFMRDDMRKGDGVIFYHSRSKPPGVAGFAEVAKEATADPTQFDAKAKYFDPKASPDDPRWFGVHIQAKRRAKRFVSIEELKENPALDDMAVVQKGQRLSVQPVTEAEWEEVRRMAGV